MKTLYDVLGVRRQATLAEIEQCYRRYVDRYHLRTRQRQPRKREQMRLQAMKDAFLILSSPERRHAYDQRLKEQRQLRNRIITTACMLVGGLSLMLGLLMIGGSYYYQLHQSKQDRSRSLSEAAEKSAPSPMLAAAASAPVAQQ